MLAFISNNQALSVSKNKMQKAPFIYLFDLKAGKRRGSGLKATHKILDLEVNENDDAFILNEKGIYQAKITETEEIKLESIIQQEDLTAICLTEMHIFTSFRDGTIATVSKKSLWMKSKIH